MKSIGLSKIINIYIFFLISCTQNYRDLKEESKEPNASLRFLNFFRIEYKGIGTKKWEIIAEEAYIYNSEKTNEPIKIIVYNFSFKQFLPSEAFIKSKKALLDYNENIIYLSEDSFFEDKSLTITGNNLKYDLEKEILYSDSEIEIWKDNNKIKCLKGIYYEKKEGVQKCKKPQGQIFQKRNQQTSTKDYFF